MTNTSDKTPEELLRDAKTFIRVENYNDAKIALNVIIEDYPDSQEKVLASLLMAEVHYKNKHLVSISMIG